MRPSTAKRQGGRKRGEGGEKEGKGRDEARTNASPQSRCDSSISRKSVASAFVNVSLTFDLSTPIIFAIEEGHGMAGCLLKIAIGEHSMAECSGLLVSWLLG